MAQDDAVNVQFLNFVFWRFDRGSDQYTTSQTGKDPCECIGPQVHPQIIKIRTSKAELRGQHDVIVKGKEPIDQYVKRGDEQDLIDIAAQRGRDFHIRSFCRT